MSVQKVSPKNPPYHRTRKIKKSTKKHARSLVSLTPKVCDVEAHIHRLFTLRSITVLGISNILGLLSTGMRCVGAYFLKFEGKSVFFNVSTKIFHAFLKFHPSIKFIFGSRPLWAILSSCLLQSSKNNNNKNSVLSLKQKSRE